MLDRLLSTIPPLVSAPSMAALPQQLTLRPINVSSHQQAGTTDDDDDDCCRTPTSPDTQLPSEAKICPPAPRKPRRAVMRPRKRSLELELLEVIAVSEEEMEAAFRKRRRSEAESSCCGETSGNCMKRKRECS